MDIILFSIKKMVGSLLMPTSIVFLVMLAAWVLYLKGRFKYSKAFALLSLVSFYLLSSSPVPDALVGSLESRFQPYDGQKVDYVLVLGGWHATAPERPVSSLLGSISLNRLTEGLMIYRANPGSKLLLSGYKGRDTVSHAATAAKVAKALGVPEEDIVLAEDVKDTAEEARHWVAFVAGAKLALVTTATHMPRSVYLFEKEIVARQGAIESLVPSPTNFLACVSQCFHWKEWLPAGRNLHKADAAWHEYLGLIWAHLQTK